MTTDTTPQVILGPRPDQATVIAAYRRFLYRTNGTASLTADELLALELRAEITDLLEAHDGCTADGCPICPPLRHAVALVIAYHLCEELP